MGRHEGARAGEAVANRAIGFSTGSTKRSSNPFRLASPTRLRYFQL